MNEDLLDDLLRELDDAEADIRVDFGDEVAETGGLYETWQGILRHPFGEYPPEVVREAARIKGVSL